MLQDSLFDSELVASLPSLGYKWSPSRDSIFINDSFISTVGKRVRVCTRLMRVRVYRNLNKPEFYSIRAIEGDFKGKVVGYAKSIRLEAVSFKVSNASRERVLREKSRNVHAYCEGVIVDAYSVQQPIESDKTEITYNPYVAATFFERESRKPVTGNVPDALIQDASVYL